MAAGYPWRDDDIRRLLACETRAELSREFPDQQIANLVNRRTLFRASRPELLPGASDLAKRGLANPERATLPPGWRPSVEQTATELRAVTAARPRQPEDPDGDEILREAGYDPAQWKVTDIRRSQWQQREDGPWLEAFKFTAVRRGPATVAAEELAALRAQVSLLTPVVVDREVAGGATFVVALSDWQIGKGENGGSEATVRRIQQAVLSGVDRCRELQAMGRKVERVALVGLGDLVEQCSGFYRMQEFQTDLTRREQTNVVRRLVLFALRRFAELGLPVVAAAIGGNHGENRKDGKAYTTFGDNDDVAIWEQVADIVAEAPEAFGSPDFVLPHEDLSLCLDLSGVRVGIVHGHQFGNGATPGARALKWWQQQSLGSTSVGACQILFSGHLHHLDHNAWGTRTHFQAPSVDGGSQWFRERTGIDSAPGVLTLLVGEDCGATGWSDLQIV